MRWKTVAAKNAGISYRVFRRAGADLCNPTWIFTDSFAENSVGAIDIDFPYLPGGYGLAEKCEAPSLERGACDTFNLAFLSEEEEEEEADRAFALFPSLSRRVTPSIPVRPPDLRLPSPPPRGSTASHFLFCRIDSNSN